MEMEWTGNDGVLRTGAQDSWGPPSRNNFLLNFIDPYQPTSAQPFPNGYVRVKKAGYRPDEGTYFDVLIMVPTSQYSLTQTEPGQTGFNDYGRTMPISFQFTASQSQVAVTDAGFMCLGYGLPQSACCQLQQTRAISSEEETVGDTALDVVDDTCVPASRWPNGDGSVDRNTLAGLSSADPVRYPTPEAACAAYNNQGTLVNGFDCSYLARAECVDEGVVTTRVDVTADGTFIRNYTNTGQLRGESPPPPHPLPCSRHTLCAGCTLDELAA